MEGKALAAFRHVHSCIASRLHLPIVHGLTSLVYTNGMSLCKEFHQKLALLSVVVSRELFGEPKVLRINIGGGRWHEGGWKNLDLRCEGHDRIPKQFVDYNHDLMSKERLPFDDDSVDMFYSEAVFEHIPDPFCEHVFREMYRCLRKGRVVRIVVPNIELAYRACKCKDRSFFDLTSNKYQFHATVEECLLRYFAGYFACKNRKVKEVDIEAVKDNFERFTKREFLDFYTKQIERWLTPSIQHVHGGFHVNWFDHDKLKAMLEKAGFKEVYSSTAQGSKFREMRGRKFDTRPSFCLFVEAVKT